MSGHIIRSVEQFVIAVRTDAGAWPLYQPRWFRGESDTSTPLRPSLYRGKGAARENELLQLFRAKAPAFTVDRLPDPERTDQWLFLARHVGLPTRLLDWSESALLGLYFALKTDRLAVPVVWMLNPLHLNHFAASCPAGQDPNGLRQFPLPGHRPGPPEPLNVAAENIAGAWEEDGPGVPLPVAVHPTYVHARLRAQRACFTVHGKKKDGLQTLVPATILKRYEVDQSCRNAIVQELAVLGVTESMAFPDLDGLARELRERIFDAERSGTLVTKQVLLPKVSASVELGKREVRYSAGWPARRPKLPRLRLVANEGRHLVESWDHGRRSVGVQGQRRPDTPVVAKDPIKPHRAATAVKEKDPISV